MESQPKLETTGQKTNILTIISLVTGIVGCLSGCLALFVLAIPIVNFVCMGFLVLFGLAGIITGFIGMNQIKRTNEKGRGMAIAGIILGVLTLTSLCISIILLLTLGPSINTLINEITQSISGY